MHTCAFVDKIMGVWGIWDLGDEEVHVCTHGQVEIETVHMHIQALAGRKMHAQVLGDKELHTCRHTCQHINDNEKPLPSTEEL